MRINNTRARERKFDPFRVVRSPAIGFSINITSLQDVEPARSQDAYESGGFIFPFPNVDDNHNPYRFISQWTRDRNRNQFDQLTTRVTIDSNTIELNKSTTKRTIDGNRNESEGFEYL